MKELREFERYLAHLGAGLGHADRQAGLRGYCTGLMAPLKRKSVEPMAAHLAPSATRSRHQSLHHFVADSAWSDEQMLLRVAQWVVPAMDFSDGGWWIVDDTGFPKQGQHSVGVARQYCGMLGKQDNCQVAVSVTLACQAGSLPVAWQLYLPQEWAEDLPRRDKAGVPQEVAFATKPAIALAQIERLMSQGAPKHCLLADAGFGVETAFRERLSELGLPYVLGVTGQVTVWPPGHEPLPPAPYSGRGNVPTRQRLGEAKNQRPMSVKELAFELDSSEWQNLEWREGTNFTLRSRFARVRVRAAHRDNQRAQLRPQEWLLIEWPADQAEPEKYYLSTLPETTDLSDLVRAAHMRWRIERDYQDLKQDLGLGHYEGRGWRGFHHHASMSIAAYGFLMAQRLKVGNDAGGKKNFAEWQVPAISPDYIPRGSPARSASRVGLDQDAALSVERRTRKRLGALPVLRHGKRSTTFVTQ